MILITIENESIDFTEYGIEFKNEVVLKGTVTKPGEEGRYPAAIIIAGSGEIDRDGTILSMNIKTNIYKDLAHLIAKLGIVTLRYDKRGVGESDGNHLKTGMWDLVSDIQAAITFLKAQPFVDSEKIILVGHSEGCMLATAINAKTPVSGLILISGAAESLEEATKRQREILYKELKGQKGLKGTLMRLLNVEKMGEKQNQSVIRKMLNPKEDIIRIAFKPINAKWFREHYQYDVYADLKKVTCPVLAIAGDKDFQTDPEKAKKISNYVQGESEVHVIRNMDHSLTEFEGEFKALEFKKNYSEGARKPLHPELQKVIVNWINKKIV